MLKGVTTLEDKKRLADAANDSDLSDFEIDEPIVQTHSLPAPTEFKSQPIQDFALSLRSFDEYVAFLSPFRNAGNVAEGLCFAALSPSLGFQSNTLDGIQLNLFDRVHIKHSVQIPMDQLCELCFREEDEISSDAFTYVQELINQNFSLGEWVWSYESVLNALQLFGCDKIATPCENVGVWSLSSCDPGSKDAGIDVYSSKDAHSKMGTLLQLVARSYDRPFARSRATAERKEETVLMLVMLLRLSCDATIQGLYPQWMQSACQAVLAHCRSLEAVDQDAIYSNGSAGSSSSPMETTATPTVVASAAPVAAANSASVSMKSTLAMDISTHSEPNSASVEEMKSPEEKEESQLSSQLHETTLSNPDSPTMHPSDDNVKGNMSKECTGEDGQSDQEGTFLYTSDALTRLEADHMSVVLLRALLGMVCCQDVTLLTLAQAAQILHVSGDAAYYSLWEYFVRAILQYRIAPYFPQVTYPVGARHPSWPAAVAATVAVAGSATNSRDNTEDTNLSTCAYMVDCIRALTAQPARAKHSRPRESLHGDPKALRGFFKLIAQYVLYHGEGIDAEDLEDLEDACGLFRKKTTSVEADDVVDYIVATCSMYLDE